MSQTDEKRRDLAIAMNRDMFLGAAKDSWNLSTVKLDDFAKLFIQVAFVVGGLSATLITTQPTGFAMGRVKASLIFYFLSILLGLMQFYIDHKFYEEQKNKLLEIAESWSKLTHDPQNLEVWQEAQKQITSYKKLPDVSNRIALIAQIILALIGTLLVLSSILGIDIAFR